MLISPANGVEPVDVTHSGEVVLAAVGRVVAPRIVDVDGVEPGEPHLLDAIAPERRRGQPEVVQRARADQSPHAPDSEAVVIELDVHVGPVYSRAASQRSASSAAMQPVPAAVTACR